MRKLVLIMVLIIAFSAISFAEDVEDTTIGLSAKCTKANKVTLSWNEISGASSYLIYRMDDESQWQLITETDNLSYSEKCSTVTKYSYKVCAAGESLLTCKEEEVSVMTNPARVKGLKLKVYSVSNNVKLTWKKTEGANRYRVYRWNSKKKKYYMIKETSKTTYTDKSKASRKKYYYRVSAVLKTTDETETDVRYEGLRSDSKSIKTYWKRKGLAVGKPLKHIEVTSNFGWRWGRMHTGTDMAADYGTPIYAVADGVVVTSHGSWNSIGAVIKIKHKKGTYTLYGHMSKRLVFVGDKVKAGQKIGRVGSTGRSTGPHLHYEIIVKKQKYNPMKWYR